MERGFCRKIPKVSIDTLETPGNGPGIYGIMSLRNPQPMGGCTENVKARLLRRQPQKGATDETNLHKNQAADSDAHFVHGADAASGLCGGSLRRDGGFHRRRRHGGHRTPQCLQDRRGGGLHLGRRLQDADPPGRGLHHHCRCLPVPPSSWPTAAPTPFRAAT